MACSTCSAPRPADRFVVRIETAEDGPEIYLCKLNTASISLPITCFLVTSPEVFFHTVLAPSDHVNIEEEADMRLTLKEAIERYKIKRLAKSNAPSPEKDKNPSPQKTITSILSASTESSLYDNVIRDGGDFAYNSNTGQYINKDTLSTVNDEPAVDNSIKVDLGYLKLMKQTKIIMTKSVAEIISKRKKGHDIFDTSQDYRDPKDMELRSCALCEFDFPFGALLGKISYRTVSKWKTDRDVKVRACLLFCYTS